jgi:hypothetical protein
VGGVGGSIDLKADCPVEDVQFLMHVFEECTEEKWGGVWDRRKGGGLGCRKRGVRGRSKGNHQCP